MAEVKATKEEIEAGLALLQKKKESDAKRAEKIARGELKSGVPYKDLPPEVKAKYQERDRRYATRVKILLRKAKEAGIAVSDAEVDAELVKK
jgi:hypothetical protein